LSIIALRYHGQIKDINRAHPKGRLVQPADPLEEFTALLDAFRVEFFRIRIPQISFYLAPQLLLWVSRIFVVLEPLSIQVTVLSS